MRLTDHEVESICRLFRDYFGEGAHLWLFGSRVDDTKRGGDIDLYIESPEHGADMLFHAKIEYVSALERAIGERHIDVIIRSEGIELPIYQIARKTGIQLV
jgi:uncharacterized protein